VNIATGIITAPRPRPTLAQSIASYRRAGFENEVIVFAEPNGRDVVVADKVTTIHNEVRLGNLRNWARALAVLESKSPDFVMICEDDISWAAGAPEFLDRAIGALSVLDGRSGAMSLYLPNRHAARMQPLRQGWNVGGLGKGTWGFQCMMFSLAQARNLLTASEFRAILRDHTRDKNIDAIVGQVLKNLHLSILYLNPCLVLHDLGQGNSSLGYRDDRPDLETQYFREPKA
jgi:hypothetical protein